MSHDAVNTCGGKYGFVAEYADGVRVTEMDKVWDDVEPGLVSLSIFDFHTSQRLLELRGYERYFFANEAVSSKSNQDPQVTAKLLGGVKGDKAIECRVDLLGTPKGSSRELAAAQVPYSPASFRAGA